VSYLPFVKRKRLLFEVPIENNPPLATMNLILKVRIRSKVKKTLDNKQSVAKIGCSRLLVLF